MTDGVILLHGMCLSSLTMSLLAYFLKKAGFKVLNIDYRSTKYPLEKLAEIIHPSISEFALRVSGQIHIVTFSMGGLLARNYIAKYNLSKLGRVVMIAPPNRGSELADYLKSFKIYKWWFGPSGQQLITDQSKFAAHFGEVNFELGVIAGNKPSKLFPSYFNGKPNDGKVSVDSTKLPGTKDHIILPYNHLSLLFSKSARKQILNFLKFGRFDHDT